MTSFSALGSIYSRPFWNTHYTKGTHCFYYGLIHKNSLKSEIISDNQYAMAGPAPEIK